MNTFKRRLLENPPNPEFTKKEGEFSCKREKLVSKSEKK
jgi:hypothetical protein